MYHQRDRGGGTILLQKDGISILGLRIVETLPARSATVCSRYRFLATLERVSFWRYWLGSSVVAVTAPCDQNHRPIVFLSKALTGRLFPVTAVASC